MKKALPLLFVLVAAASLSACQSEDTHGVIINRGSFLGNLFGAAPVSAAPQPVSPAAPQAKPAPSAAQASS